MINFDKLTTLTTNETKLHDVKPFRDTDSDSILMANDGFSGSLIYAHHCGWSTYDLNNLKDAVVLRFEVFDFVN